MSRKSGFPLPEKVPMDPPPNYEASGPSSCGRSLEFQTTFACISLNMTDRLRLIRFPSDQILRIEQAVRNSWAKGIQETRRYGVAHELKLKGNPWSGTYWDKDKAAARGLLSSLLGDLYSMGWVLKACVDLSKKSLDKDSLLFRYQNPAPPPCDWLSVSFMGSDKLYLVNAPTDVVDAIVQALGPMVQRSQDYKGSLEIKLSGSPWWPSGEETVTTRIIAITLLEVLEKQGYSLYATIDQDNGSDGQETDTWHCCKLKGWQPGQPVYHS